MASPMPRLAPVTIATLPSIEKEDGTAALVETLMHPALARVARRGGVEIAGHACPPILDRPYGAREGPHSQDTRVLQSPTPPQFGISQTPAHQVFKHAYRASATASVPANAVQQAVRAVEASGESALVHESSASSAQEHASSE